MLRNFFTYQLAKELYLECRDLKVHGAMKDQLDRACLSIVLNLSEGYGKITAKDRRKFYSIAFGSLRETQTMMDLLDNEELIKKADHLGACIYKLLKNPGSIDL